MITKLGKDNSFMLFGATGQMEQNERVRIGRGTLIYAFGYAMSEQRFVVYDDEMNAVEICTGDPASVDKYDLDRYFSPLHHLDDTTRPISKKFGIGFYYDESGEIVSDEVIEKSLQRAENLEKLEAELKAEKERKEEETRERLIKEYDYLQRAENKYEHKTCGANIRTELKRNFPNVKFSVRYESFSGNNAYDISWTDGPTRKQVDAIVDKYSDMHPDEYSGGDYWDCAPSIFNNLFGSVGYVTTSRHISEEAKSTIKAEFPEVNDDNFKNYRFENEDAVEYIHNHGPSKWDEVVWYLANCRDLSPKAEPKKDTEKKIVTKCEGLQIVDYSEKAIALVGDSRAIKDELKKIGGRFNPRLSCGAGWIFSKKQRTAVEELIK